MPLLIPRLPASANLRLQFRLTFPDIPSVRQGIPLRVWTSSLYRRLSRDETGTVAVPVVTQNFTKIVQAVYLASAGVLLNDTHPSLQDGVHSVVNQVLQVVNTGYENEAADNVVTSLTQLLEQSVLITAKDEGKVLDHAVLIQAINTVFSQLDSLAPECFTQEEGLPRTIVGGSSDDPNSIRGPVAYFSPSILDAGNNIGWVSGNVPLTFLVYVENNTTRPGHVVLPPYHIDIRVPLDGNVLDLTSMSLGQITLRDNQPDAVSIFPNPSVTPLAGRTKFVPPLPLLLGNLPVSIATDFDLYQVLPTITGKTIPPIPPISAVPGVLTWNFDFNPTQGGWHIAGRARRQLCLFH